MPNVNCQKLYIIQTDVFVTKKYIIINRREESEEKMGKIFIPVGGYIIPLWMIVTVVVLVLLWLVYAGLIKKKNNVKEAFASIDVQLKKR